MEQMNLKHTDLIANPEMLVLIRILKRLTSRPFVMILKSIVINVPGTANMKK